MAPDSSSAAPQHPRSLLWDFPASTVGECHSPTAVSGASPQTSVSGRLGAVTNAPARVNFGQVADVRLCPDGRECRPPCICKHGKPRAARLLDALLKMERRCFRPTWWDWRDGRRSPGNYLLRVARRDRLYDAMQKWLYAHDYLRGGR